MSRSERRAPFVGMSPAIAFGETRGRSLALTTRPGARGRGDGEALGICDLSRDRFRNLYQIAHKHARLPFFRAESFPHNVEVSRFAQLRTGTNNIDIHHRMRSRPRGDVFRVHACKQANYRTTRVPNMLGTRSSSRGRAWRPVQQSRRLSRAELIFHSALSQQPCMNVLPFITR